MKKRIRGFTLVELIVVIAIIGVLAAILVPSMMGYVKNSRLKSANTNAKIVFNAANSYATKMMTEGRSINQSFVVNPIDCTDDGTLSSETNELRKVIAESLSGNGEGSGWAYIGFDEGNCAFEFARWTKNKDVDGIVGQYPNPPEEYDACPDFDSPSL